MGKRILTVLFLLAIFCCASVFAQQGAASKVKLNKESAAATGECRMFGKTAFVGSPVKVNLVDADVRDVLLYFTEHYGCNFIVDKAVGEITASITVKDVSWNEALGLILKSRGLAVQVVGSLLRVAEIKTLKEEANLQILNCPTPVPDETAGTLETGFFKPEHLPRQCPNDKLCERRRKTSSALKQLETIVERRLTKRGKVEVDEYSQTLIIKDAGENLKALKILLTLLVPGDFYNKIEEDKQSLSF